MDFVDESNSTPKDLFEYYASEHPVDWDGGYDIDRFPSYRPKWRTDNPLWTHRLSELGVFDLVEAEESTICSKRALAVPTPRSPDDNPRTL